MGEEDSEADRRTALDRLLVGYYGCVNYAFNQKNPTNPMVDREFLEAWESTDQLGKMAVDEYGDAHSWFAIERTNLVHLAVQACEIEPPAVYGPQLAFRLFYLLERGGHWSDWEVVTKAGLRAARSLNDNEATALLLRNQARLEMVRIRDWQDKLRVAHGLNGDPEMADMRNRCVRAVQQYVEIASLAGPSRPEVLATIKREIADIYLLLARFDPTEDSLGTAERTYEEAAEIYAQLDDCANPLASLSVSQSEVYRRTGELLGDNSFFDKANVCLDRALKYARQDTPDGNNRIVHPALHGYALLRHAELQLARRDLPAALQYFNEAANAFQADNNWLAHARTVATNGRLLIETNQSDQAGSAFAKAHDILTANGSPEAAVIARWLEDL